MTSTVGTRTVIRFLPYARSILVGSFIPLQYGQIFLLVTLQYRTLLSIINIGDFP